MDPDIENITLNEYLEYKAAKERKLWDNVRSKRSPTNYDKAAFDSFQRNKSSTFNYPYSHNLPHPRPCSLHVQPNPKNHFVATNVSNDVDIESKRKAQAAKDKVGGKRPAAEQASRQTKKKKTIPLSFALSGSEVDDS
nr:hypothetical protein [Tanacetum cinerariifolium]